MYEAGSPIICCAREALRDAVLASYFDYAIRHEEPQLSYLRFLRIYDEKMGEMQTGVLERDSLLACFKFPTGTKVDEIIVPEWSVNRWCSVRFTALFLDCARDLTFLIRAKMVVAECDREKLPGYVHLGSARCSTLDWAPVLVSFSRKCSYCDHVVSFTYKRFPRSGVFNFMPQKITIEVEC